MRIAAVFLPHLPCAAEALRDPSLAGRPLVIGDSHNARSVLDCSGPAHAAGVRPGMQVRQAMSRCPDAAFLPPDPAYYRDLWDSALAALDEVSPEVEDSRLGRAYLNVAGLEGHYHDDLDLGDAVVQAVRGATGLEPSAGIGDSRFVAFAAAVVSAPAEVTVVPRGRGAAFLAPLDVSLLPVSGETLRRLEALGIESIGEVAAVSAEALLTQFGREGSSLWELAHGADSGPLRVRRRVEVLEESVSFEAPVVGIDVIIAGARQLLSRLSLQGGPLRGRAARELCLKADLSSGRSWEKRVVFREAISETDRLLYILKSTLSASPPPAPVKALTLRLSGLTGETGKQLTFGDKSRLQRQLEEAIRQLKARYGFSPIYRCVDVEPWSVIPEERQVLVESDA
jgi:nucleotidyltransferase/DNA polymerase involved in DNA repair